MAEKHYCDRCKKELGYNESWGCRFKREAVLITLTRDFEFCRECADKVLDFALGKEVE